MPKRRLPASASVATPAEGARLVAPAAGRNVAALCDLLAELAPQTGTALELASGTGQHVVQFAARLPRLHWQPSEIDATRRASIDSYAVDSGQDNIAPAIALDATAAGWAGQHGGQALIVLINLLHLISDDQAEALIREAASALARGGRLVIYGPFMRAGELTSKGDASFHASLIADNPEIGYKDDFDVMDLIQASGLDMVDVVEMPANNLALVAKKPAL